METTIINYLQAHQMLAAGDRVGVGVSGGSDSMALLVFLSELAAQIPLQIVAVHVNHRLRKSARADALFVKQFCAEHNLEFALYTVDTPTYAATNKLSIEAAARVLRYQAFEQAMKKYHLNKFALAHHLNDQAETILMHLFRGCGLDGASGMAPVRGPYIRPFLAVKKSDLINYNYRHNIPHVEDESNADNDYQRNFVRNVLMPEIVREWRNAPENIVAFGKIAARDSQFIAAQCDLNGIVRAGNVCRVPLSRFFLPEPVITRVLYYALGLLDARRDVEIKHIQALLQLAADGLNGEKVSLPNQVYAVKEYEYISLVRKEARPELQEYAFKVGKTTVEGFGTVTVTKTISYKLAVSRGLWVIDADKLPKKAKWRFPLPGDRFEKLGGGTKKLNAFLTDKKVPARLRPTTPVLAVDNTIYVVGGVAISEQVKTDRDTIDAYVIDFIRG